MPFVRIVESPFAWAAAGFAIGLGLAAANAASWGIAIGIVAFMVFLSRIGPARPRTEGKVFATGPALIVGWMLGFVVRGLIQ